MFSTRTNWPLETNRLTRALEEHRKTGKKFVDLTVSNPTTCGFTYPDHEISSALADPQALMYRPESKGLREAREAVAAYSCAHSSFGNSTPNLDPERIVLTSGTSEAYSHIFRLLCEAGEEILVPAPSYPLFEFLADLADIHLISYPLLYDHGWQIDFASLRDALTPHSRAVMVVHPNNPTGSLVKPHEAAELFDICAARDMAIVADEVFLDYSSGMPQTFVSQNAALTFTLSGLSKISLLPQMKLAWIAVSGPESLAKAAVDRLEIIADTYLSPGTPVQVALPKLLSMRQTMQTQVRRRVSANLSVLDNLLNESKCVSRLEREGGWYAILRVPVTGSDEDLAVTLLDRASVYVHPGHFFNFSGEGFLVISLITPEDQFNEGCARMLKSVDG
jgi:alanine-synthesizing transaminase